MEFMVWEEEVKRYSLSFFLQQPGQLVLLLGASMKRREISGGFFFFLSTKGQTQRLCQCLKQGIFCILAPEIQSEMPCSVII